MKRISGFTLVELMVVVTIPPRRTNGPFGICDFAEARHRFASNRGFTLIELLVVVTIIVVLLALLVPAKRSTLNPRSRC